MHVSIATSLHENVPLSGTAHQLSGPIEDGTACPVLFSISCIFGNVTRSTVSTLSGGTPRDVLSCGIEEPLSILNAICVLEIITFPSWTFIFKGAFVRYTAHSYMLSPCRRLANAGPWWIMFRLCVFKPQQFSALQWKAPFGKHCGRI